MNHNSTNQSENTCPNVGTRGPDSPFYHWLAMGYVLLFILALTANLRVLFKLFHYSRRRFRDHILLLNLCAADLFVTLVYIPSEIYAYSIGRWHSDEICKALAALKGLGIYASSVTIIGISVDRYLSIVHPLTVYQSNIRNKLFVVGSWIISGIACVPQLIIFKRLTNEALCREMCGDTLSSDPLKRLTYNIAVAIFAYIAPLITIFYSYFRILYVLQKRCDHQTFRFVKCHDGSLRSRDTSRMSNTLTSSSTKSLNHERRRFGNSMSTAQSSVEGEINTHNMRTITRAKLKTLKLTALIVICFILCWTPYYCIVFFLLITDARMYYEQSSNPLMNTTMTTPPMDLSMYEEAARDERPLLIVMMLAVSNSVLDPLIYGCYLVRPLKSGCWNRCRSRSERRISRRTPAGEVLLGDKDSKLSTARPHTKHAGNVQHLSPAQCHL